MKFYPESIQFITRGSNSGRTLVLLLTMFIPVLLIYAFLLSPLNKLNLIEINHNRSLIKEIEQQELIMKVAQHRINEQRKITQYLSAKKSFFIKKNGMGFLYRKINKLAVLEDVKITAFLPEISLNSEPYYQHLIKIIIQGGYGNIIGFLNRLVSLNRLFKTTFFSILPLKNKADFSSQETVVMKMQLVFYEIKSE